MALHLKFLTPMSLTLTSQSNSGSLWNKIGNFFKAETTTQKPKARKFDSAEAVKYNRVN